MRGNVIRVRDDSARQILIAAVFALIFIAVDVVTLLGIPGVIARQTIGLPWLITLNLTFVGIMVYWVSNIISAGEHVKYHNALHKSFREELLAARDQDEIVDLLFQYVRFCIPVTGGALYIETLPGDESLAGKREWFKDVPLYASTSADDIQPCDRCISRRSAGSGRVTNLLQRIKLGSQIQQSQVLCRWISVKDQRLARICLYLSEGVDLSELQSDYLSGLIIDCLPAIQWARMREIYALADKSDRSQRIQLAHYLHDTLVNDLSFLNFKVEQIQSLIAPYDESSLQSDLHILGKIANRSYLQVRDELFRLRESSPSDLMFAVKQTVDQICSRTDLEINFVMEGQSRPLGPEVNRNILYIIREILRNVEKHADAGQVDVMVTWDTDLLRIQISDNGRGFSPATVQRENNHFGLGIVHECAQEINADLEINSVLNGGTQVALTLPL